MPPLATDRCGGDIVSGIRLCVRPCGRAYVLLARDLTNQRTEFHQTLADDVVKATDKPLRF